MEAAAAECKQKQELNVEFHGSLKYLRKKEITWKIAQMLTRMNLRKPSKNQ